MTSVLREHSHAVLSEGRWRGFASAVHEPSPVGPYRASSIAPAGPSARATLPWRSPPKSSTPRVRLHLKPGQKGTKQLLAQYGDRPPRRRFAHDQIVGLRVPFADVAVRDRVKKAGGT